MAPRRARAFTLIEVLATIAFMSILLPTVMHAITLSLTAADNARQQAAAASLAHGKLSELVSVGQLQHAVLSGDFGEDWPGFRWQASLNDWDGINILQLDVTVYWRTTNGGERSTTLTTIAYNYTLPTDAATGGTP